MNRSPEDTKVAAALEALADALSAADNIQHLARRRWNVMAAKGSAMATIYASLLPGEAEDLASRIELGCVGPSELRVLAQAYRGLRSDLQWW